MSSKKTNENKPQEELLEKQASVTPETEAAAEPAQEQAAPQNEATPEAPNETETLKVQLEQCNDKLLRTLAEYDNYRKRSQRERADVYPDAVAATVTKLLPVVDNFERALEAESTDADFKKGVEMIFNSLRETLKGLGVEEIEALGKEFDPNLHNAVMHTEDDSLGENTVAQVMQKGYKLGDRVLRHAMVQVAN